MRDLTAGMQTALQDRVLQMVHIVRLDIADDPVYAWSGPGLFMPTGTADGALNDLIYDPAEDFADISSIKEDQGIGGPLTITAQGHHLDSDLLRQVVRDKRAWRAKPAYVWLGLLDTADEKTVIADPARIKAGVITSIQVNRSPEAEVVQVAVDEDLAGAKSAPFYLMDHPRIHSGDTATTYMAKLLNKPKGLDASDVRAPMSFPGLPPGFSWPFGGGAYWN